MEHTCQHEERFARIDQRLENLYREIYGNGDSSRSISSRLVRIEESVRTITRLMWMIAGSTLAAVTGLVVQWIR